MTYAFGFTTLADLASNVIEVLAGNRSRFTGFDAPLEMLAASYVPCDINNPDQVTIDYRDVAPIDARLRVMIAPGGHIRIQKAVDDGDYIDDSGEWQTVATVVDDDDEKAWDQIRTPEAMIYDTEAHHDEEKWHEALRTSAVKLVRHRLEETLPQAVIDVFAHTDED